MRLVSIEGLGNMSIGMLAKEVGMSKSGLFAHFQSKEELQLAVLATTAARFTEKVVAPAVRKPRGRARLTAMFDGWIRWDAEEFPGGCVFYTVSSELDDRDGPVREHLVQSQRQLRGSIARMVQDGIDSGQVKSDADPDQFAFEVLGIVYSFIYHHRLLRDPFAVDRARTSFAALLDRIGAQ